jgi:hypothetical protein
MKEVYIMFSYNDGDPKFRVFSKGEITEELNEEGVGEQEFVDLETLMTSPDPNYWHSENDFDCPRLIIKGTVIVPKEKEVVTHWSVEE